MNFYNVKENTALIDKLVISNIIIVKITDMNKLIEKEIIRTEGMFMYITASGQQFNSLSITNDIKFDKLYAKAKADTNTKIQYCKMELSIKDKEYGNLNCNTIIEYYNTLFEIQRYLEIQYGIEINLSEIKIDTIEINQTFRLENLYNKYDRVISVLVKKSKYRNVINFYKKTIQTDVGSYVLDNGKSSINLKIYDKTKHLRETKKLHVNEQFIRFEFTLSGKKLAEIIDTKKFIEITDRQINEVYQYCINKYILCKIEDWENNLYKNIKSKYLIYKDKRNWKTYLVNDLANETEKSSTNILDISQIYDIFCEECSGAKARYEMKHGFENICQKYQKKFIQDDYLKLSEILQKLKSVVYDTDA